MNNKFFSDFGKNLIKMKKTSQKKGDKSSSKKTTKKTAAGKTGAEFDIKLFKEKLNRIIISKLVVDSVRPIDNGGFSPEGADLIAYREYCKDIINIMDGHIPFELIYGTYYFEPKLDKNSLASVIKRVSVVKKLNKFSEVNRDSKVANIPAFIIAGDSDYSLIELKNDVINYYISNSVGYEYEFDILMILNKGVLIKNWRERRSYIGLETNEDTMLWFFILMNEYLEAEKDIEFDLRDYVNKDIIYNQY